ncbi:zinc finger protein 2 homolog isoform X2 [Thunnus maccoyii]|uniref:zinc finger protein 2 homolog isoform X2 n=1 Tax=Thunnus maccoyii TaxID=8240 RepID=UPI001C4DCD6F|nr:zinc finger protein 2 homolog isoform X2 [Thunnus maccoyii]
MFVTAATSVSNADSLTEEKSFCHRVKMSKVQMLRAVVDQRLTAAAEEIFVLFERSIAEYEEELSRSKEENERQRKLLDAVFNPQLQLHRAVFPADVQQLFGSKEEAPPEQQEWSSSLDQEDPEPPHIKEEQEELWTNQEGEQLQGLQEADITKFTFTPVPVTSEDVEEKPQSSQLQQRQTEENKDSVGGEEVRNLEPDRLLQADTDDRTSDCSEVRDDGWTETSEPQPDLNSVNNYKVLVSDMRCNTVKKQYNCSECGKIFQYKKCLNRHMRIHTGEKSFKCLFCGKAFVRKEGLTQHVRLHTGEKPFSCRVCHKRFTWQAQVKQHHCIGESSQFQTEAEGKDCGGSEAARNSHPDRHLKPDADDKSSNCSERDPKVIDHACEETMEPLPGLKMEKNNTVPERCNSGKKKFYCSECGKIFDCKEYLQKHMRVHSGEKPYSCLICNKRFSSRGYVAVHMKIHTGEKSFKCPFCGKAFVRKEGLTQHVRLHTGEKPFSCRVCHKRFTWPAQVRQHHCVGESSQFQTVCSSTPQTETEADGENGGGSEPARNFEISDADMQEPFRAPLINSVSSAVKLTELQFKQTCTSVFTAFSSTVRCDRLFSRQLEDWSLCK